MPDAIKVLNTEEPDAKSPCYNDIENLKNAIELMKASISTIREENSKYYALWSQKIEEHSSSMRYLSESIELNKIYCYIIPRLINSSGIGEFLKDDFDISNINHANELRKMLMDGILMDI